MISISVATSATNAGVYEALERVQRLLYADQCVEHGAVAELARALAGEGPRKLRVVAARLEEGVRDLPELTCGLEEREEAISERSEREWERGACLGGQQGLRRAPVLSSSSSLTPARRSCFYEDFSAGTVILDTILVGSLDNECPRKFVSHVRQKSLRKSEGQSFWTLS